MLDRRAAPRFGMPCRLSAALLSGLMSVASAQAADSLADLFLEGRFDGQLRLFYIDRNFTGIDAHQYAFAIGGYLRYDTGIWHGVQLGRCALCDRPDAARSETEPGRSVPFR